MLPSSLTFSPTPLQFINPNSLTSKFYPSPLSLRFRRSLDISAAACTTASSGTAVPSLYEVLGIPIGASDNEIKAAYRRLARSCHPDVAAGRGQRESPPDDFIKVHAAYLTLSDPEKRADYDQKLCRGIGPSPASRSFPGLSASPDSSTFCRFPRRNWETDQCW